MKKRVLFLDVGDRSSVSLAWRLGATIFRRSFDEVVEVRNVSEVYAGLARHADGEIGHAQVWGHGYPGHPVIGMPEQDLPGWHTVQRYNLEPSHPSWLACEGGSVWFRSCSVAQGVRGHAFMNTMANMQGINVAAHLCVVGTWGVQSWLVGVQDYDDAWWPKDLTPGNSNPMMPRTVLSTAMSLPRWTFSIELKP